MSALSALSGDDVDDADLVGQRAGEAGPARGRRASVRNAASVFPEPVGAAISVWRRLRMAAQPCACAGVGSPSVSRNHCETMGWKEDSGMEPRGRF